MAAISSLLLGELESSTKFTIGTSSALAIFCLIETRFRKSEHGHGGAESERKSLNDK